jgi:hypothetical protein
MPIKTSPLPPLNFLNEILYLDESSPSGLRWKITKGSRAIANSPAGTRHNQGYWSIGISTDKKRMYLCHRIIYYMKTGEDLIGKYIDHPSGDRNNNKHLRVCTHKENLRNRLKKPGNINKKFTSKFKGVSFESYSNKWKAQIHANGNNKNLGRYETEEQAAEAYNQAALEAFGQFAKLNEL